MKKILLFTTIFLAFTFILLAPIYAQTVPLDTDFDVDNSVDIQPIKIKYFGQISLPGGAYSTIFSWVSFGGALASLGIVVFWIYIIMRSAFIAMKSQGNPEGLTEAMQKAKSLFIGASIAMIFPISVTILGYFLGIGGIWNWPEAFRECPNSPVNPGTITAGNPTGTKLYNFYFQAVLGQPEGTADPRAAASAVCY